MCLKILSKSYILVCNPPFQCFTIDMERQDYINQINSLQATIKNLLSMIDTLRQTLESVNASSKRNEEVVKKLSAQIEAYQKQIRNLEDRDKRHNKNKRK